MHNYVRPIEFNFWIEVNGECCEIFKWTSNKFLLLLWVEATFIMERLCFYIQQSIKKIIVIFFFPCANLTVVHLLSLHLSNFS